MNWFADKSLWILLAVILFVVILVLAFLIRNNMAKTDQKKASAIDPKAEGSIAVSKRQK